MDRDSYRDDAEHTEHENNQKPNAIDEKQSDYKVAYENEDNYDEKERDSLDEAEMDEANEQFVAAYEQPEKDTENSSRKKRKKFGGFLGMVAAAIIGSVLTLGAVTQLDYFQPDGSVPETGTTSTNSEQTNSTNAQPVSTSDSVADMVDNTSDAIVGIVNMTNQQQNPFTQQEQKGDEVEKGVGSGVIYKVTKDEAYIVTNNHVIENASSINVSLANGDTVDGELIGTDPLTDIAVVKIKGDYDIEPVKFGDSDELRSGDQVIAIGNPLGLDLSRTVTQGIISATDRSIPVQTSAGEWEFDVIQTDAAINPGNSGGALLNSAGELVGINSLKIANNGVEGLGFSIPINEVDRLIDELVDNGKIVRPYVGVGLKSVNEIPPYYLQQLPENIKEGAVVLSVDEQSAAGKAGIEVEDVIVGIDGDKVTNDKDFRTFLYKKAAIGDNVEIELYHDGELKTVELTLTSNEDV